MWVLGSEGRLVKAFGLYARSYEEIEVSAETSSFWSFWIELKSLILAQIERWRHALHMQVERQHGLRPGGEWRTGE